MTLTDPIADMLTRVRNALMVRKKSVNVLFSKMNLAILDVLKREGFIDDYRLAGEEPHRFIRVYLKYGPDGEDVIHEIRRVSKPGRRVYSKLRDLNPFKGGLGIRVLSTSKGILSDRECKAERVAGEVICEVW